MKQENATVISALTLKVIALQQKYADCDHLGLMESTGVVYTTVRRWKEEETKPSPRDCVGIADYAAVKMKPRLKMLRDAIDNLLAEINKAEEQSDEQTD